MNAEELLLDNGYEGAKYLVNFSYDTAIVGVTDDMRVVYDYDLMVEWLMKTEGFSEIDAMEWIDYNTKRAIPFMGENAPIIMNSIIKERECMNIAKFEKVSFKEFRDAYNKNFSFSDESLFDVVYQNVKIPTRATKGSAGYDFVIPFDITLKSGESIKIPTGIRVKMEKGWVLKIYPRSSMGFKYRLQLDNTVGIIDEDYYYADNEGHIIAKITNDSKNRAVLKLKSGDRFMQGIFVPYGLTYDDNVEENRFGGIGSTDATRT